MIAEALLPPRVVVYEGTGATPLAAADRSGLFASLLDRGYAVTRAGAGTADLLAGGAMIVIAPAPLPPRVIVYEGTGAAPLPAADRAGIFAALLDRGYAVTRAGAGAAGLHAGGAMIVIGCFPDGPPAVSDTSGRCEVMVRDVTGLSVADAVAAVETARGERRMNRPPEASTIANGPTANTAETWKPWFPVIDTARCTNSMQCLSFCLFDVYG